MVMAPESNERKKRYLDTLLEYIAILGVGQVAVPGVNIVMSPELSALDYNNAASLFRQQSVLFIRLFLIGCTSYSLDLIADFTSPGPGDLCYECYSRGEEGQYP